MSAFRDYFDEWLPMSFCKTRKSLRGGAQLRQVHSIDDLCDDKTSPKDETAAEVGHGQSEGPLESHEQLTAHRLTGTPGITEVDSSQGAIQPKAKSENILGPCGHLITTGTIYHQNEAIERLLGCEDHRRNGLLADCRKSAVEELHADGSLKAGGDTRAKKVTNWVKTAWPAAWGAEVRLTEADGSTCFLDTGETAVPCEYRGETRVCSGIWDDDDEI